MLDDCMTNPHPWARANYSRRSPLQRVPTILGGDRVAGRDCSRPAPLELCMKVSSHTAQALRTPSFKETRFRDRNALTVNPVMALRMKKTAVLAVLQTPTH